MKQEPGSLPSVANVDTDRSASKNGSEGRRSSISRNASFNILGSVLPMFVTLATVPPYLKLIGDVRFGVLSLVWVFLGYFGLFEMGLGRATSKYIAQLKNDAAETRESVFWTALLVNLAVGSVGGLLLWIVASVTMPFWLKTGGDIQAEVARSMPWLAAAVPVATLTSVLVGALEGREEFGAINSQQIGATVVFQLVPLGIAAWLGPRIDWLVAATVLTRVATNVPLFVFCVRRVPLRGMPRINREWVVRLWRFGIWITVSGIASPILTSLDRFVIGFAQGAQAVTYYAIPYGFASKLLVFPSSVSERCFRAFPQSNRQVLSRWRARGARSRQHIDSNCGHGNPGNRSVLPSVDWPSRRIALRPCRGTVVNRDMDKCPCLHSQRPSAGARTPQTFPRNFTSRSCCHLSPSCGWELTSGE